MSIPYLHHGLQIINWGSFTVKPKWVKYIKCILANMTTFLVWKKRFLKDMACKTRKEVNLWLEYRGIKNPPSIVSKYCGWVCRGLGNGQVCLCRDKLILNIDGFKQPYRRVIISLLPLRFMIKREYFNIFGNACKITGIDKRVIERNPSPDVVVHLSVITAYVQPQYKEERSGSKISNFYLNIKKRRHSNIPSLVDIHPRIGSKRSHSLPEATKFSLDDLRHHYRWSTATYHKRLVHYFTNSITKNIENPRLVLMFGVPGSGKNWVLEKRRKRDHVIINVDDCLAMLPSYWRGILELHERDKRAHDWIRTFRAECQEIATQLLKFALNNRMNIVWNGTGKNIRKYSYLIELAKKKNYIIELNGIWVPLMVAKNRMEERRKSYGRAVPDSVFNLAALNIPEAFQTLRDKADYARIWQNSFCESPKVIWDKHQGWMDKESKNSDNIKWISSHYTTM